MNILNHQVRIFRDVYFFFISVRFRNSDSSVNKQTFKIQLEFASLGLYLIKLDAS